jgi:hypothetical protein
LYNLLATCLAYVYIADCRNNSNKYQVLVYNATVLVARDEFRCVCAEHDQ